MIVKFHSVTDLITNSSTTLYTYSDASPQACQEMIDEIFKTLGVAKTCNDVFRLTVLAEDSYIYGEWKNRHANDDDEDEDEDEDDIDKLIEDILNGRAEKPKWMEEAEKDEDDDGYTPSTQLHIVAKSPEFETLAELIVNFLYSTHNTATGAE